MAELPRRDLHGIRVLLREPAETDIADVVASVADPQIRRSLPHLPDPYGPADARRWIDLTAPERWANGGACFVIADAESGRLQGSVSITMRHHQDAIAEITYWLAPWGRGQGLASETLSVISGWALNHGLGRLELRTATDNPAGQRVGLAAGYRREGVQRGAGTLADGSRYDVVMWARLAGDPPGPTPRLLPDLPGNELSDGIVSLHPLTPADADDAYAARTLPEISRESVPPDPPSRAQVLNRCADAASDWLAGANAALTIRDAVSDSYAGEIALRYTEPSTGTGMIGYHLTPQWRGAGFATRAVRLVTGWALDHVGLIRVEAGTNVANTASQAVLLRVGFRRVGLQLSRRPGPDSRIDDVLFELVAGR